MGQGISNSEEHLEQPTVEVNRYPLTLVRQSSPVITYNIDRAAVLTAAAVIYRETLCLEENRIFHCIMDGLTDIRITLFSDPVETSANILINRFTSPTPPDITILNSGTKLVYRSQRPIEGRSLLMVVEPLEQCPGKKYASRLVYCDVTEEGDVINTKNQAWVDGRIYELNEVYGIGSTSEDYCVVCMSAERTTAMLPCRHMCLCWDCASFIRLQRRKCPMCRSAVSGMILLKATNTTTSRQ